MKRIDFEAMPLPRQLVTGLHAYLFLDAWLEINICLIAER